MQKTILDLTKRVMSTEVQQKEVLRILNEVNTKLQSANCFSSPSKTRPRTSTSVDQMKGATDDIIHEKESERVEEVALEKTSLRAVVYELQSIKTQCSMVFFDYYFHRCNTLPTNFVYSGEDAGRQRNRIRAVLSYMYSFGTDHEKTVIDNAPQDSTWELFDRWVVEMKTISNSLEDRMMIKLRELELEREDEPKNKKGRAPTSRSVGAVYYRMYALKLTTNYEEPLPKNQKKIDSMFQRKV